MKISKLFRNVVILALLTMIPILGLGQAVNFAQIQGRVTDASGAALNGANVTVTQTATGFVRTAVTSGDGHYALPTLPIGPYTLRVSAAGFSDYLQKGIVLQVGEQPTINVEMKVGAVTEVVEVAANAATVETHDNSISNVIDNERIMELPLDGRSAPQLVMLAGAAANPTLPSNDLNSTKNYGNGTNTNPGASQVVAVAGGQQNSNNYMLDGSDNNDSFSNINAPFPFPDAIQEFSVQNGGMSARYGVHAGATVNAVTKSGTNKYHGTVFEFLRNPILNAKPVDFSANASGSRADTIKRNQFGGTFGGPISKDKLFLFLGYQGTRQRASSSPVSVTVPTAEALNGDFSIMMSAACNNNKNLVSVNGVTITNKHVDPARFNPQSLALLKYVPASTDPTGCGKIQFTYPQTWNEDQGIAKLDWNLSSKHTLFGRYYATDSRVPLPFDENNILSQNQLANQYARYQTLAIGDTYSFSPNFINSIHLTAKRLAIHRGAAPGMPNPKGVGINVGSPIPSGLVVSVSSYSNLNFGGGSSMPGYFINELYQASDDIDIVKGKHQFSFGGNWMWMRLNYLSTFQSNSQITFGGSLSGDNLVDFMLGFPSQVIQSNDEKENWGKTYLGFYAHDNIRLRSNLTVNLGIRWEPFFPAGDKSNRGSHFDYQRFVAGQHSTVYPNAPAGLVFCGDSGVPCSFGNKQWKQFSPRVGMIWDPKGDGKTSVRASYGMFYDTPEMYYFDRYADNPPYGGTLQFTPNLAAGANLTNPYLGSAYTGSGPFPMPFPKAGDPNNFFPLFGVYINNEFDYKPMYTQNWSFGIEQQLAKNWLVSLTYLGSKTTHIWVAYEANPGMMVNVPATATGIPGCTPNQAPSTSNTNCRRALMVANPAEGKYFSYMTSLWDGANANYNGLLASVKHPFGNNFTFMGNYTWSHCISDQDFTGELTNSRPTYGVSPITNPTPNELKRDRSNCGFDVRHVMNYSLVASSPKFKGLTGAFLSDWQLAPMITYRSGTYFTILSGTDVSRTGTSTNFKDRPNLTGDPYSGTCGVNGPRVGTRNCWFNTGAFTPATAGTYGNVGRNSILGPKAFTFDLSLSRTVRFKESQQVQTRFEAFNVLNHPNYSNPNGTANNSQFGRITGQNGSSRTFQLALKYMF